MKYQKERNFVKLANDYLKEEVIVSKIIILESGIKNGVLNEVMYEDRFKRQFIVKKENDKYFKTEYKKESN